MPQKDIWLGVCFFSKKNFFSSPNGPNSLVQLPNI